MTEQQTLATVQQNKLGTVVDIPDVELVERAVINARSRRYSRGIPHMRWRAVMNAFGVGSTYAQQLCRRFGLDPDEIW